MSLYLYLALHPALAMLTVMVAALIMGARS
jgi:hypothetical protein